MAQRLPSHVLAWVDTRLDAITSETPDFGFAKSAYRFTLDKEPESAVDGLYFVDMPILNREGPYVGNGERQYSGTVTVRIGYLRPGGDLGCGDRQSVLRNASDDMVRIADVLARTDRYDGANTGITSVIWEGAQRIADRQTSEIWEARFTVNWRGDEVTA